MISNVVKPDKMEEYPVQRFGATSRSFFEAPVTG